MCTHVISHLYFLSLHISSQHGTTNGLDYQQVLDMTAQKQTQKSWRERNKTLEKKKNINMIEDAKPGSSANFLFQDIKPQLERN